MTSTGTQPLTAAEMLAAVTTVANKCIEVGVAPVSLGAGYSHVERQWRVSLQVSERPEFDLASDSFGLIFGSPFKRTTRRG